LNVVSDMVQPCSVTTMAKMDGADAGVETRAPSWGKWLRYITGNYMYDSILFANTRPRTSALD